MNKMVDLITGGTGFIGTKLVEALSKQGRKLRVLVRKTSKINDLKRFNPEFVFGDINDKDSLNRAVKGVDTVFHLAGFIGGAGVGYKELHRINVVGTRNLMEACAESKVKKVVHFSSVSAMGEVKQYANEDVSCNPVSFYDKSKYKGELAVREFKRKFKVIIVRPTIVYGPGELKTRMKMFKLVNKGVFRIIGHGRNLIAMVYVDNLIEGVLLADKKGVPGEAYILSDERVYTMNEFFGAIAKEERVKIPGHIPKWLAYPVALAFEVLARISSFNAPLSFERIRTLTISKSFSIEKAKRELGYSPKVGLREGVRRTVGWYKEQGVL